RGQLSFRLTRELARQAVLITLEEQFRLPVRDETLGEVIPENASVVELALVERLEAKSGKWRLKLVKLEKGGDAAQWWTLPAAWETTLEIDTKMGKVVSSAVEALEGCMATEF